MPESYNELVQMGPDAFTVRQMQEIAKSKFGVKLRGGSKQDKFQNLLNLYYQATYLKSIKMKFESNRLP